MRKSIFDIEIRINILDEFKKIVDITCTPDTVKYERKTYSYIEFIDKFVFNEWKYRGTCLESWEYFNSIGIDEQCFKLGIIDEINFLYYLEFLLNMNLLIHNQYPLYSVEILSKKLSSIFNHNIDIILEKMNYKAIKDGDKIIIVKRDADVDSIVELVPENIGMLLLEYNDIRNNDIESKESILKKIDKYIEKDKNKYKQNCSRVYEASQTIVNNFDVNHLNKKVNVNKDELKNLYDKCFRLYIHLIRNAEVQKITSDMEALKQELLIK